MKLVKEYWLINPLFRWLVPMPIIIWYARKHFGSSVIYDYREYTIVGLGSEAKLTKHWRVCSKGRWANEKY
jgi:hypothetical protein